MSTPLPPGLREIEARLEADKKFSDDFDKNFLTKDFREQVLAAARAAIARRAAEPIRARSNRWISLAAAAVALLIALNAACASKHREPGLGTNYLHTHAQAMRFEQNQQFLQEP